MKKIIETLLCKSDAELAHLAEEGSNDAIEALVLRHEPALKKYLHALLHNPDKEKDTLQEMWEKVLLQFRGHKYTEKDNLEKWLRTIIFHIIFSKKKKKVPVASEAEVALASNTVADEAEDELNAERIGLVNASVTKLNDHMRLVIKMQLEENLTITEIAKRLHIKINTATSEFSKAIAKLRLLLGRKKKS